MEITDNKSTNSSFESNDDNEKIVKINTVKCKSELKLVRKIIEKNSWREVFDETGHIFWTSLGLGMEDYKIALKSNKFLSRIPGISDIAEKKTTGFILNKYLNYYPND